MYKSHSKIEIASKCLHFFGLSNLFRIMTNCIYPGHIRVFNYHHVPENEFENFKRQVNYLLSIYKAASPVDLQNVLDGKIDERKPWFILTFDDGFESHGTYVADYLASKNIVGWFFVPTAAPDVPEAEQHNWALDNKVLHSDEVATVEGRVFASWDVWREVSNHHIVASHTHNHKRFESALNDSTIQFELNESFNKLSCELKNYSNSFCWVGGELGSYSLSGVRNIIDSAAELAFTTCSLPVTKKTSRYRIERTNVESSFSMERVRMSVSGLVDLRYFLKRKKLSRVFISGQLNK